MTQRDGAPAPTHPSHVVPLPDLSGKHEATPQGSGTKDVPISSPPSREDKTGSNATRPREHSPTRGG